MIDKTYFTELLTAATLDRATCDSAYDRFAASIAKEPRWEAGVITSCENVIDRIIETEFDVHTPGKRGLGRLHTMLPRLAAEYPAVASARLMPEARRRSRQAARSALFATLGSLASNPLPTGEALFSEEALWLEVVPVLNAGAAEVERQFNADRDIGIVLYSLGFGASKLIEAEAERVGEKLYTGFRKGAKQTLFQRILVFHATFGWSAVLGVTALAKKQR